VPPCIKAMSWCDGGGTGTGSECREERTGRRHEQSQGRNQSADTSFITSDHSGSGNYFLCTAGERLVLSSMSIGLAIQPFALIPQILFTSHSSSDIHCPALACLRPEGPPLCHSTARYRTSAPSPQSSSFSRFIFYLFFFRSVFPPSSSSILSPTLLSISSLFLLSSPVTTSISFYLSQYHFPHPRHLKFWSFSVPQKRALSAPPTAPPPAPLAVRAYSMGTVTLGAPKTQLCVLFLDPLLGNSSTNKGESEIEKKGGGEG
jgi:hypothetical protein